MVTPQFFTDFKRAVLTELLSVLKIEMNSFAWNWTNLRSRITRMRLQEGKKMGIETEYSRPRWSQAATLSLSRSSTTSSRTTKSRDENPNTHSRKQARQRANHWIMRRDEDLTSSAKKPVVLRSGKEKPVETTGSHHTVDPATGWRWYCSPAFFKLFNNMVEAYRLVVFIQLE